MYLEHFGLDQHPFRITPNQDFFYSGANRGAILDALAYAITSGEGIVKLVGEVGTGKTMLCRALESRLPDNVDIIYLANPSLPPDEIIYALADELGLMQTAERKSTQIIREMQNHLIDKHAQGRHVVVFIDEAQAMPLDSLEEIRLLSNLETGSSKLLQIVLFGQPELDQRIDQPQIRQLKERITHSFYLHPFSRKEIDDYLAYRMRIAGYRGPHVFSQGAIRLVGKASQGLIRRVNILADKSLLAAFSDNSHAVTVKQVRAAIQDSGYIRSAAMSPKRLALAALLPLGVLAALWWVTREWPSSAPVQNPKPAAQPVQPQPQPAKVEPPAATFAEYILRSEQETQAPAPQPVAAQGAANRQAKSAPTFVSLVRGGEAELVPQNPLQSRLDASREWIDKQNDANFTIQLMAVPSEAAEVELARIQEQVKIAPEQLFIYATTVNKKPAITIALGAFPSVLDARAALAKLPAAYLQNQPLLRTFKGMRNEIEKK